MSLSAGFGDEVGLECSFGESMMGRAGGGGSIGEGFAPDLEGITGSGKAGIGSSAEAVSIVI